EFLQFFRKKSKSLKKKNSENIFSNDVGVVEKTASGKFIMKARKRKIPNKEQWKTVRTSEAGMSRLEK
ncbi:MAG TPA: hypothetical protein DDW37_10065, partial [Verrucomicrobiales bacterium]|nr:hypothetical protein [Verrucomicrobiales bacterium]